MRREPTLQAAQRYACSHAFPLELLQQALQLCQEGLALVRDDPELWLTTVLLDRLAMIAGDTGQAEPAASLFEVPPDYTV